MKISFFCIATEPFKNKYPIIESIKSILPIADEVVVIFGREEKSSYKDIKKLGNKVKIYQTNLWPIDWSYDVMTYHFDFGLKKCTGDFCVKFDIDYIFKYRSEDTLKKIFSKNIDKYHKIYLPKYNYLDKNHWMVYPKGIYCINKKLILKDHNGDEDAFFVGNRNYVNELIVQGKITEWVYPGGDIKVFNYDCTFMNSDLFYDKQYRWYNAYYKKWGNLKYFGLTLEILNDKDKLIKFAIERTKERIEYAAKNGKIYFDNLKFNPAQIRGKLRKIGKNEYGHNFFGLIKLSNILYNKVKVDELGLIKKYYEKISEEKAEFKEEELQKIIDKNVDKNKMIRISKFCRI